MFREIIERDWLTRRKQLVTLAIFATALGSAAPAHSGINVTVFVTNVNELYAAVNSVENAGATIVLGPGVYTLSARDGELERQNGGRLDLQPDMSLSGVVGARDAVVIDAGRKDEFGNRLLPVRSFAFKYGRTGVIRAGCGSNRIEWLTILGNPLAAASIETDLVVTNSACRPLATAVRVAHVVAGDSSRGVDVRNVGVEMADRRIVAEIEDSEFYFGIEGIRMINFNGAHGGEITVDMRGNRAHGNRLGCIMENNRSDNASIAVRSFGDQFWDNGLGCMIGAALVGANTGQTANLNTTRFDARETRFTGNTRISGFNPETGGPEFSDRGGVLVLGAEVLPSGAAKTTSGNTVIVRFWDVIIADNVTTGPTGNQGKEFLAFGARSDLAVPAGADPTDYLAGTDNHALIQLRGLTALIEAEGTDSEPQDPNGTNTVTIVRIPNTPHQ
jgi:hypothetical protein